MFPEWLSLTPMKCYSYILLFAMMFINGCSNDIDISAEWREIPIVYGLLDPSDSKHYVVIYKGFIDDELDNTILASNPDSIYFPDVLDVTINDGQNEFTLQREDASLFGMPKDTTRVNDSLPLYPASPNYVYTFSKQLNVTKTYELTITNTTNGNTYTSSTTLLENFKITRPLPNFNFDLTSDDQEIQWDPAKNAEIYELTMRFSYTEWNVNSPGDKDTLFVDWVIPNRVISDIDNPDSGLNLKIAPNTMYAILSSRLSDDNNLRRNALDSAVVFFISCGGSALREYIQLADAQGGITQLQIKPVYSNITDGLGIFSSRFVRMGRRLAITPPSLDSLSCGQFTQFLNFTEFNNCPQ